MRARLMGARADIGRMLRGDPLVDALVDSGREERS